MYQRVLECHNDSFAVIQIVEIAEVRIKLLFILFYKDCPLVILIAKLRTCKTARL